MAVERVRRIKSGPHTVVTNTRIMVGFNQKYRRLSRKGKEHFSSMCNDLLAVIRTQWRVDWSATGGFQLYRVRAIRTPGRRAPPVASPVGAPVASPVGAPVGAPVASPVGAPVAPPVGPPVAPPVSPVAPPVSPVAPPVSPVAPPVSPVAPHVSPAGRLARPASPTRTCKRRRSPSPDYMDTSAGQGLYPLHHCKTLHLVRHAQGYHNVAGEKDVKAYLSYDYLDASLTSRGWEQVDNLRKHVQGSGLSKKFDLVITSPLTRTIQNAVGVFGGGSYNDGVDVAPLMVADAGNSGRPAISSFGCPPFLAVESCRDHLRVHPCNKRRTKSEYETLFPAIDFSLIENDDILWKEDVRETDEELAERGMKFLKWLWTRSEKKIAIVSHSGFLFHTLSAFGKDCHQAVKDEICKQQVLYCLSKLFDDVL